MVRQRDLVNHVDISKTSRTKWLLTARTDMFAANGPLSKFRPFQDSTRKINSLFKKHIRDMLEIASKGYIEKLAADQAPLYYEVTGHELLEALNASELEVRRKSQERQIEARNAAERQAQLRRINQEQGLVPPIPVPTQPVPTQPVPTQPNQQQPNQQQQLNPTPPPNQTTP